MINFLQSSLGLGFLSQYDQKSISILDVCTLREQRKKKGNEQIEKKNRRVLYPCHSEVGFLG